jgi:hypothetical protein
MAFRFVLFLVSHLFLRMSHLLFPLAFDLLASLRARPIASIASCLSVQKFCSFACSSELLLLTTSLMGVNAAALSTDSAGPGLRCGDGIPCVGISCVPSLAAPT